MMLVRLVPVDDRSRVKHSTKLHKQIREQMTKVMNGGKRVNPLPVESFQSFGYHLSFFLQSFVPYKQPRLSMTAGL